jgi:hypothetical protein
MCFGSIPSIAETLQLPPDGAKFAEIDYESVIGLPLAIPDRTDDADECPFFGNPDIPKRRRDRPQMTLMRRSISAVVIEPDGNSVPTSSFCFFL